jgi:hypothetical protein
MKRECVAAEVSIAISISRHCAATLQFGRFLSEADMGKPFAEPNL